MIKTRPYQDNAIAAALKAYDDGYQKILEVMATGLGKTTVVAELVNYFPRSLVLAHRRELVFQAADRIRVQSGIPVGIALGTRRPHGEAVTAASVQTMRARPRDYIPEPDFIVVDEAHHAVSPEYLDVLSRWPNAKVLGVTATPDRGDHKALGSYFEYVAYRYETPAAIDDGWLSDFAEVEAHPDDLIKEAGSRRTIVFTTRVKAAKEIADGLPDAAVVHGSMSKGERGEVIKAFKKGTLQFLVNCNILTEGFDCPEIECVAMDRATQSRALFMQCLGRGLRLAPGKDGCLLLTLRRGPRHDLEGPEDALAGIAVASNEFNSWYKELTERFVR